MGLNDHPRRVIVDRAAPVAFGIDLSAIGAETALTAEPRRALDTDLASDP